MSAIDPRTGCPLGDHGAAQQAIIFSLNHDRDRDANTFLRCWLMGDLEEWPDYYQWLNSPIGRASA